MTSLGIRIVLEFMHLAWSLYSIKILSFDYTELLLPLRTILPILCIFVCILCETMFLVPRRLWQINTCLNLPTLKSTYIPCKKRIKKNFLQYLYVDDCTLVWIYVKAFHLENENDSELNNAKTLEVSHVIYMEFHKRWWI